MAGGRDNLYSRLIAWLKVLLPLAALGIVAALFLTSRTIDPTAALTGAGFDVRELARDMRVRNPDYNTMTDDGTAVTFTADSARPDPDRDGRTEAVAVIATFDPGDGRLTTVRGDAAVLDRAADRLTLTGNVSIETSDGYHVESAEMISALSRTDLRSDVPVRGLAPFGEITAATMRLTREGPADGHVLVFNGRVKLVYQPSN